MNILTINNLSLQTKDKVIMHNFSHEFTANNIYAIIGKNGAGKTTFLKTISGLLPIHKNKILLNKQDIYFFDIKKRSEYISMLLQFTPFDPYFLGHERIAHGLKNSDQILIENISKKLNILHLLKKPLSQMSGGEQRLIYIAKTLISQQTSLYLLDEPNTYLDFTQQDNIKNIIIELKKKEKIIIFSSHDKSFIKKIASHLIVLEEEGAYVKKI